VLAFWSLGECLTTSFLIFSLPSQDRTQLSTPNYCSRKSSSSKFTTDGSVGQSVLVSGSHLEPMTRFLFSVRRLRVSCCGAPSLTRGWVCNLLVQLLLGLARAVVLGSKSRGPHDRILQSHLRLPQLGGPGPCIYIPQEQGGEIIPLGTGFPVFFNITSDNANLLLCLTN
jgi:hypothetical protein